LFYQEESMGSHPINFVLVPMEIIPDLGILLWQVEVVSGTLIMRWVNTQLSRVTEWVDRSVQQEVSCLLVIQRTNQRKANFML
jgi:hypothetical protein